MWIRTPFKKNIIAPVYFHELGHFLQVWFYNGDVQEYMEYARVIERTYRKIETDWHESVAFLIGSCAAMYWDKIHDTDYFTMCLPYMEDESESPNRPFLILRSIIPLLGKRADEIKTFLSSGSGNEGILDAYAKYLKESVFTFADSLI